MDVDQTEMGYGFLVGHQFSVGDLLYTVRGLSMVDKRVFVDAETMSEGGITTRWFPAATAVESLLVEEEIELFNPHFSAAASS